MVIVEVLTTVFVYNVVVVGRVLAHVGTAKVLLSKIVSLRSISTFERSRGRGLEFGMHDKVVVIFFVVKTFLVVGFTAWVIVRVLVIGFRVIVSVALVEVMVVDFVIVWVAVEWIVDVDVITPLSTIVEVVEVVSVYSTVLYTLNPGTNIPNVILGNQ